VIGNAVLAHVTRTIGTCVRASDVMGRVGGEEFAVIWHRGTDTGAAVAAEQIRATVEAHPFVHPGGQVLPLHVTIGTAHWPRDGETSAALLQAAMQALTAGKRAGRNRVVAAGGEDTRHRT
jgi:diguanylate cyclase (GGDEF)-like protein